MSECSPLPDHKIIDCREHENDPIKFKWYGVTPSDAKGMPDHFFRFTGRQGNGLKVKDKNGNRYLIVDEDNAMQPFFDQVKKGYKIFVEIC